MTALLLAICLGAGISLIPGGSLHRSMDDLRRIIMRIVGLVIITLLPLHIFGLFMGLTLNGQLLVVVSTFSKVVLVALALSAVLLLAQYVDEGICVGRDPAVLLKNMPPAAQPVR